MGKTVDTIVKKLYVTARMGAISIDLDTDAKIGEFVSAKLTQNQHKFKRKNSLTAQLLATRVSFQ